MGSDLMLFPRRLTRSISLRRLCTILVAMGFGQPFLSSIASEHAIESLRSELETVTFALDPESPVQAEQEGASAAPVPATEPGVLISPPTSIEQVFADCPNDDCCCRVPNPMFGGPWLTRPTFTGDWGGKRTSLLEHGVIFEGNATQFYQGVVSGGREQESKFGGHADYYLTVLGDKAGLGHGLIYTLHGETLFGESANGIAGTLLPVSLVQLFPQTDSPATALTAAKVTKIWNENWVTFAGKINMLDELKQPFASGRGVDAFMNGGLLFNCSLLRTIPYSTLGGGFAYMHNGQPLVTFLFLDTNNTPTTTGFESFFNNGVTTVGNLSIPTMFFGQPGHQNFGFSYSNGKYTTLDRSAYLNRIVTGAPVGSETGSQQVFYSFDQTIAASAEDPTKSWGLFGNLGLSDNNPSPVGWFGNIGVGGSNLWGNRPLDTFGAGYFHLGVSNSLQKLAPNLLPLGNEQGVEFFYNYAATPWLRITPDLQVVNSAVKPLDTSVILGLRTKIVF